MSSTSRSGNVVPLGCVLVAAVAIVGVAGCDQGSPVTVDPGADLVSYSHIPWTGCTAWDGPAFGSVTFAKGSAELDDEDRVVLEANVARLNLCPDDGFHVKGLAVNEPRAKHLAAERAQVVADYYTDAGAVLFPGRMEVQSYIVAGGCGGKRWGPSCDVYRVTQTLPF